MTEKEIFDFLDEKADAFNQAEYIESDPLQIPHQYSRKQDVEISGFLAATIAWGNRKSIVANAYKMMHFMGESPYDFVMSAKETHFKGIENKAIHRTFNAEDFKQFVFNLQRLYQQQESLAFFLQPREEETNFYHALERFRTAFLVAKPHRCYKHVSSTYKNSAAKRLMMYLRWMVRYDKRGVDLGIWKHLDQRKLSCPLDVHSGNIARYLGILNRKQNDWKAVEELDLKLRQYKPQDPALYDFALFGLGVTKAL
ncbi:TIGR02757 family protein [Elizabethkingia argentiflava]|uniref:TIGR02757 family protein n=1 Tax=Elizabethkingia argenteiflava TaxID=2681556 RepID=A0A845PS86_9FLAO|nr:TIGR02757 family protein [Elizabethkingia argenteiflava]NAW51082.1 TIGR02757 family protein [Elizabethkingia argenteiflava]